jgi:hypothetical protein
VASRGLGAVSGRRPRSPRPSQPRSLRHSQPRNLPLSQHRSAAVGPVRHGQLRSGGGSLPRLTAHQRTKETLLKVLIMHSRCTPLASNGQKAKGIS